MGCALVRLDDRNYGDTDTIVSVHSRNTRHDRVTVTYQRVNDVLCVQSYRSDEPDRVMHAEISLCLTVDGQCQRTMRRSQTPKVPCSCRRKESDRTEKHDDEKCHGWHDDKINALLKSLGNSYP